MSIVKNVSGPYIVHTINAGDPIILDSGNVIINGNLFARGASTVLSTTNTDIYDNIITLNRGVSGTPILNAGLTVVRGTSANVALLWNESAQKWQITNDGTTYANVSAYTTGQNMQRLSDDPAPVLGGNLFVGSNAIVSTGNIWLDPATQVNLNGNLSLQIYGYNNTSYPAGYNTVNAGNVSAGGTGLFVTSGDGRIQNEELISKKRAIVYSIIF
jgi:hypothetical protein